MSFPLQHNLGDDTSYSMMHVPLEATPQSGPPGTARTARTARKRVEPSTGGGGGTSGAALNPQQNPALSPTMPHPPYVLYPPPFPAAYPPPFPAASPPPFPAAYPLYTPYPPAYASLQQPAPAAQSWASPPMARAHAPEITEERLRDLVEVVVANMLARDRAGAAGLERIARLLAASREQDASVMRAGDRDAERAAATSAAPASAAPAAPAASQGGPAALAAQGGGISTLALVLLFSAFVLLLAAATAALFVLARPARTKALRGERAAAGGRVRKSRLRQRPPLSAAASSARAQPRAVPLSPEVWVQQVAGEGGR
jgi:hypothetical protein